VTILRRFENMTGGKRVGNLPLPQFRGNSVEIKELREQGLGIAVMLG
jgi:hypothetical protein